MEETLILIESKLDLGGRLVKQNLKFNPKWLINNNGSTIVALLLEVCRELFCRLIQI